MPKVTEKFEKQMSDSHVFLVSLHAATLKNVDIVNAKIENLTASLQTQKEHF